MEGRNLKACPSPRLSRLQFDFQGHVGPTYYAYCEASLFGLISLPKGYVLEIYIGAVYDVVFDPRFGSVLALINSRKVLIRNPNHDPNVVASKWWAEILDWSINSQIFDVVLFVLCYHFLVRWQVIA
ncbi:hypothetical protein Ancab_031056 [Ancistrocladus abbreviatus]